MARVRRLADQKGNVYARAFRCPGCHHTHTVHVADLPGVQKSVVWRFNGNDDKPTFAPSVLETRHQWNPEKKADDVFVCHFFVTDGRIHFLGDCWHDKKGQTLDLPDIQ